MKRVIKKIGEGIAGLIIASAIPAMLFLDIEPEERALKQETKWETFQWEQPETESEIECYANDELAAGITRELTVIASEPLAEIDQEDKDAYLLARIAMAESENQDTIGKALVIATVINRIHDDKFPDTVQEVIFEERNGIYQFSPIGDGRWERVEPDADCWEAVDMVMNGWDESEGALYFEKTTDSPTWHSRNLKKLFEHQDVTFYTDKDK